MYWGGKKYYFWPTVNKIVELLKESLPIKHLQLNKLI